MGHACGQTRPMDCHIRLIDPLSTGIFKQGIPGVSGCAGGRAVTPGRGAQTGEKRGELSLDVEMEAEGE